MPVGKKARGSILDVTGSHSGTQGREEEARIEGWYLGHTCGAADYIQADVTHLWTSGTYETPFLFG